VRELLKGGADPGKCAGESNRKRVSISNLSGNEVYYKNALILLIKIMLCSKLHYQKGFTLRPLFYKIFFFITLKPKVE